MDFKEFLQLSEQMPPPPMTGGPSGPPDVSNLLKALIPDELMQRKGGLQKAIGGKKTVLAVANLKTRGKVKNLGAAAIDDINTDHGDISNATVEILPKQRGSTSKEFTIRKYGKKKGTGREIRGKGDNRYTVPVSRKSLNDLFSPHKIGGQGGPGGAPAANGMLPGPGMGMGA